MQLRTSFKIMGIKLLQLAFYYKLDSDQLDLGNWHLPHHHLPEYVVYSESHDGQMIRGWFSHLDAKRRDYVHRYLQINHEADELWFFIETVFKSCAKLAIIPMQDILGLDNSARMNDPKHPEAENWTWRYFPSQIDQIKEIYGFAVEEKLAELAERYERC
jgi:4-alpha-glucanotransferase